MFCERRRVFLRERGSGMLRLTYPAASMRLSSMPEFDHCVSPSSPNLKLDSDVCVLQAQFIVVDKACVSTCQLQNESVPQPSQTRIEAATARSLARSPQSWVCLLRLNVVAVRPQVPANAQVTVALLAPVEDPRRLLVGVIAERAVHRLVG